MTEGNRGRDSVERLLERAHSAESAGEPWRAREMLQGSLRSYPTDVRVLEAYGRVLDRLGDRVEAGKYLFLSGMRGPDVDETIALFVSRHGRKDLQNLVSQFPRPLRRARIDSFPEVVASDLQALALPRTVKKDRPVESVVPSLGLGQGLVLFGCAAAALLLLAVTIIGFATIVRWIGGA